MFKELKREYKPRKPAKVELKKDRQNEPVYPFKPINPEIFDLPF